MAVLECHPDKQEELLSMLREFYTLMQQKGYSRDLLYNDAKETSRFVHLRIWNSDEARSLAQQDPDVHRYWMQLPEVCTITTIYEDLVPVFSSYKLISEI